MFVINTLKLNNSIIYNPIKCNTNYNGCARIYAINDVNSNDVRGVAEN